MSQITLPAQFDNISLRKDGSCLLKFESRELTAEQLFTILQFRNTEGWLLFSQNREMKAPEMEAELDTKSPSERLKNALSPMKDLEELIKDKFQLTQFS